MESAPQDSKYQAFISYSRHADGELIAPALQRGLQGFAKPWYRLRALRVFRDDDNLSANPAIWPSVQEALDASEHFILLASPESAQSEWVAKELQHWLASHEASRLLLVQTDGAEIAWDADAGDFAEEGNDAVPDALREVFSDEPRYVDLQWARERDQISLADPRFRDAVADIAAPLRGVPKDEIVGEHVRQHRRARRTAIAGASGLAVLTAAAVVFGILALVSRQQAVDREQETRSVLFANASSVALESNSALGLQFALAGRDASATAAADAAVREATTRAQPSVELAEGIGRQEEVAFAPDGATVAAVGRDGVLRIWDVAGGPAQTPTEYPEFDTAVNSVRFSPDGDRIAIAGGDGVVRIWAVADGPQGEPVTLEGHEGSANSVAFSPDGERVVTAGFDGTVRVWRADGRGAPVIRRDAGSQSFLDAIFSPDGATVAAAGQDGGVRLWPSGDADAAPRVLRGAPDDGFVGSIAFAPDGAMLAAAGIDGLRIWALDAPGAPPTELSGHLGPLESVTFTPDGTKVVSGARDRTARIFDLESDDLQNAVTLAAHRGDVTSVSVSPDGEQIATVGSDGRLFLWEADGFPGQRLTRFRDTRELINAVALDRDGEQVAAASFDGPIMVRNVGSSPGTPPRLLDEQGANDLAFDETGRSLVSAGSDGAVRVWDLEDGAKAGALVLGRHDDRVLDVAVSDEGERIVSGGEGGQVRVWDTSLNGPEEPLDLEFGDLTAFGVAISPDGRYVAAGGVDRTVRVWDLETPATIRDPFVFPGSDDDIFTVAFSPDGRRVAAGGEDGGVRLWNIAAPGSEPDVLGSHDGWVNALEFSTDGSRILSVSNDGTARIWDVGPEPHARPITVEPRSTPTPIFDGSLSADGTRVAFSGEDVQVRDCIACGSDMEAVLELAEMSQIGDLDDADRERITGG